jgi:hypothetical protein
MQLAKVGYTTYLASRFLAIMLTEATTPAFPASSFLDSVGTYLTTSALFTVGLLFVVDTDSGLVITRLAFFSVFVK